MLNANAFAAKAALASNRAEGDVDRLVKQRFFPNQSIGVFIDIGAARPDYLSMSALYRLQGWQVLAIEQRRVKCPISPPWQ
jgi:hypothetical protein